MRHKGEIIEKAVRESGYSITKLAQLLGKSRRWVYLLFEKPNAPNHYIEEIGKIINYDFSGEISGLSPYDQRSGQHNVEEPDHVTYQAQVEFWKNKYLQLLEEYNALLKKG